MTTRGNIIASLDPAQKLATIYLAWGMINDAWKADPAVRAAYSKALGRVGG